METYLLCIGTGYNEQIIYLLIDKLIVLWMDGWMDGWMDRWMDGWMDRYKYCIF